MHRNKLTKKENNKDILKPIFILKKAKQLSTITGEDISSAQKKEKNNLIKNLFDDNG